jgi:hypothetical protein
VPISAEELEQALSETATALEAGDPVAASLAAGRAARTSAALEQAGESIPTPQLTRLRALQARCEAAAASQQQRLAGELDGAARSRRADAAYRR